ncbi:hypothetical protein, conserved [Plasmodium gonderi]|uniref:Asparagine-rich protein n=1 Tax=Plasmodium gonderi TaxID=77519 RepID=A0A1Y1JL66_PLAGO|nr:hypothetical protein, conserved [Plasmodium gonderi]GAW82378.1 hypothetical protein, conserved [Plasmodium gonderi]
MNKCIPILTQNILLRTTDLCIRERKLALRFLENIRDMTTNIAENKEIKIKNVEELKLKSLRRNKSAVKGDNNEDVYILNGKILYAQKNKKEKTEFKAKHTLKRNKSLDTSNNLFYAKLNDNLRLNKSKDFIKQEFMLKGSEESSEKIFNNYAGREPQDSCYNYSLSISNGTTSTSRTMNTKINATTTSVFSASSDNIVNDKYYIDETNGINLFLNKQNGESFTDLNLQNCDNSHLIARLNEVHINRNLANVNAEYSFTGEGEKMNKDKFEACVEFSKSVKSCESARASEYANPSEHANPSESIKPIEFRNPNRTSEFSNTTKCDSNNNNRRGDPNEDNMKTPPENSRNVKHDIFEILNEINSEKHKEEMKKFLNSLLLYKNNKCTSFLGNYISLYFCNILSQDLKDLKYSYFDGVGLCVNTFFSVIKELDEDQLSKMSNIYLKEYFLNIFQILKSHNLSLHFENLKIENMRPLYIYNILGLIRKEGKRTKKENIKKFLYQYICVQDEDLAILKNSNRMKFLSNIIKNGVTTRMHMLVTVSYDICAYDTISSSCITKTKYKNVNLEFILENQLENPFFSLQSPDSIDLKSSGWYLVDVNQILKGNLPYE